MGHNDASTHPAGFYSKTTLTNTLDVVSTKNIEVAWGVIVGGAAAHTITFRRSGAGATYFDVRVPANAVIPLLGFRCKPDANAKNGLELISGDAAGDVTVDLFYVDLG